MCWKLEGGDSILQEVQVCLAVCPRADVYIAFVHCVRVSLHADGTPGYP